MIKKILFNCFVLLASINLFAHDGEKEWASKNQPSKVFIENKGQYLKVNNNTIQYAIDQNGTKIYFSGKGLTYAFFKNTPKKEDEREKEEREHVKDMASWIEKEKEEHKSNLEKDYVHLIWENANPYSKIVAEEQTQDYYSYAIKQGEETVNITDIKSYKKITYKNLYPNIDVEYIFHPTEGLKYSIILHPGADITQVKMRYTDANKIKINSDGDLHIRTDFGDIIDHAPLSFYADNNSSAIISKFIKNGNSISFELENYDKTQTVVIDPWVLTPTLANSNCVWECEKDGSGNVYIIGGDVPMKLLKYNAAGALQWTFVTVYDTSNNDWLGTFATDLAGNSYVTCGSTAALTKVNTAGTQVYSVTGGSMDEYWNIAFNCDQTKLIIGGTRLTGIPNITGSGVIFDINTSNGGVNSLQTVGHITPSIFGNNPDEVRSITSSYNARYYYLTLDSMGAIDQNLSTPCSSSSGNSIFKINHTYNFGYKCENYRPQNGNSGIMAIRANKNFVYTQNGKTISKRDLATGAIITTVTIPGGISTASFGFNSVGNSGIDIDSCGNVYVGSGNAVIKYDQNLNQLASVALPFAVYDVSVSYGGNVIVAGATGTSSSTTRTGYVQSINMSNCNPMTLVCCDANVCAAGPFCTTSPSYTLTAATPGGTWSGTGVNASGVFNPSVAGSGIHTIVYTLACGSDSLFINVRACASLSVCVDGSGNFNVSGGTSPYSWSTQQTVTSCTACIIGCNFPPGCQTTTTTWSVIATNTASITPPGTYPLLVQDGAGNSYTVTALNSVPNCTITCTTPTITINSTNVSCFGGSNGAASAIVSPVGTYTYTWQNGNLNGQTQTALAAGVYTVTASANGCNGTATVSITQPSAALSSSASVTSSITCNGLSNGTASVSISGGTPTYTVNWSNSATGTSASGLGIGTYTATITDANHCTTTSTVTITQPPAITITPQGTGTATCGSSNGSATVTASGGTGPLTYSWNTGATGPVLSNEPGGTYTVIVTDGNNCTNNIPVTISSSGGPTANGIQTASVTCNGASTGTASVTITGGTPSYTVNWSNSITGTSTSGLGAGTYTAIVTDANNCVTTTTVSIVQPPPINISFSNNTPSACGASTGSVTANASGGTGVLTYSWSTGATTQTLSNIAAGSYTVTATDANHCTQVSTVNITTINGPTVTPAVTATVSCHGASTGSASVAISGGTPSYTVNWSSGGTGTSVNGLAAGTYTVIVTDAASCVSLSTVTISQAPAITINTTSSPAGCVNPIGSATAIATGGTGTFTYTWSNSQTGTTATNLAAGIYTVTATDGNNCVQTNTISVGVTNHPVLSIDSTHNVKCNGQTNGTAYASATSGTPTYTYTWSNSQTGNVATNLSQGTYTIVVTDAGGCVSTTTVSISQPQVLSGAMTNITPESCNQHNGAASVNVSGGTPGYTYQWNTGPTTQTITNLAAGSYTVTYTDAHGCIGSTTVTIASIPGPTATASQTNNICNGGNIGTATVTPTGGTPNYSYNWSNSATTASVTGLSAGIYSVTVTDAGGCTYTLSITITQPNAIAIVPASTQAGCSGGSNGTANVTVSGGTAPYNVVWSNGQTGMNATHLSLGTYTAVVTDNNGCVQNQVFIITENPPVDSLEVTGLLCLNDPTILLTAPNGGAVPNNIGSPYQWYLNNSVIIGANSYTYTANSSVATNYSVNWFYHGCRYITTNIMVTIAQDMGALPQTNIFTPNADNINDDFIPFSTSSLGNNAAQQLAATIDNYDLSVYDRWGILIFHSTNVATTWDGKTTDGKDCLAGTYFWIAKYTAKCSKDTGEQTIKGYVQLIR